MPYDMKYGRIKANGDTETDESEQELRDRVKRFNDSNEPVFIIRAKDVLSVPAIARYQVLAIEAELPVEFTNSLNEVLATFSEWQYENAVIVKKPD